MTDDQGARIETVKIKELTPDDHNANKGTDRGRELLGKSVRDYGAGRSVLLDRDKKLIAGNKTVKAAVNEGIEEVIIVHTNGKQLVAVQRDDLALDDPDGKARELAVYDNRTGELDLEWDLNQLKMLSPEALEGLFSQSELIELGADWFTIPEQPPHRIPDKRKLPLDVIYTLQMADCTCCLAIMAGWKYGIQSAHYRLCPYTFQLSGRHEVAFVDNDYFNYDHQKHLDTIRVLKPKYATVRDVMSEEQCRAENIRYYPLEMILDWAEELKQFAQNVIVIPKYDCLDQIPSKFMLGYSIPTSHGGTPLPVEMFKGRRIHLLGGSWKAQLDYLALLGDDVQSLDNNQVQKIASEFGLFTLPNGETKSMNEAFEQDINNVRYSALALSFGFIGTMVNQLYQDNSKEAEQEKNSEVT